MHYWHAWHIFFYMLWSSSVVPFPLRFYHLFLVSKEEQLQYETVGDFLTNWQEEISVCFPLYCNCHLITHVYSIVCFTLKLQTTKEELPVHLKWRKCKLVQAYPLKSLSARNSFILWVKPLLQATRWFFFFIFTSNETIFLKY